MTDPADGTLMLSILRELREQRTLLLKTVEYLRQMEQHLDGMEQRLGGMEQRLDRRMVAVRDDLELMLKSELMGRLSHFETTIDHRLDALEERINALESR